MTEEQYNAGLDRIDAIADSVAERLQFDSFALTAEDRALLAAMPEDILALIESELARFTPASELDIRVEIVARGIVQLLKAVPDMRAAYTVGYDMAVDT